MFGFVVFRPVVGYSLSMELSDYAKPVNVSYKTAWQWWEAGHLNASQLPTGTLLVREPQGSASGVAPYAHGSSADQKDDAVHQLQRLHDGAAARGYRVVADVSEIASGVNDERPTLKMVLTNPRVGVIVVERQDRRTRFGYGSVATLFTHHGRRTSTRRACVEEVLHRDSEDA